MNRWPQLTLTGRAEADDRLRLALAFTPEGFGIRPSLGVGGYLDTVAVLLGRGCDVIVEPIADAQERAPHFGQSTHRSHCASPTGPEGRLPSSDLKPHLNDRLGNCSQAGVVIAGMRAYELVGLIDSDSMALGGDPLGLFDDDP